MSRYVNAASSRGPHFSKYAVIGSLSKTGEFRLYFCWLCLCSETWCCSKVTCPMGPLYWYYKQAYYIFLSVFPCLLLQAPQQDSDEMYILNVFFVVHAIDSYLFQKTVFKRETVLFVSVDILSRISQLVFALLDSHFLIDN